MLLSMATMAAELGLRARVVAPSNRARSSSVPRRSVSTTCPSTRAIAGATSATWLGGASCTVTSGGATGWCRRWPPQARVTVELCTSTRNRPVRNGALRGSPAPAPSAHMCPRSRWRLVSPARTCSPTGRGSCLERRRFRPPVGRSASASSGGSRPSRASTCWPVRSSASNDWTPRTCSWCSPETSASCLPTSRRLLFRRSVSLPTWSVWDGLNRRRSTSRSMSSSCRPCGPSRSGWWRLRRWRSVGRWW